MPNIENNRTSFNEVLTLNNICIERFWRSIKYEELYLNHYKSMKELRYSIDKYMEKYNTRRLHSAIGNRTPNEVYFKSIKKASVTSSVIA